MSGVEEAINILKKAVQKAKSRGKKNDLHILDQVASYMVYLKSTTISLEATNKLKDVFRRQLPALYSGHSKAALNLTSLLCRTLYEGKIMRDFAAGQEDTENNWQRVLNAVLSGVLDVLEDKPSDKFKEAVGSVLYSTLCETFFSTSISHMSVDLRCTGYSVLSESAQEHEGNQKRLRDSDLLGGIKLGSMLWRTRDYLVLENVLDLFARIIPRSGSSAEGRATRRAFIRSVFVDYSPDDIVTGEELANMVEHVNTPEWEQTESKIIDVLAGSNIGFPQPFKVYEISIGVDVKPSDRVFIDGQGFLANVLVYDDMFDSLSASYSTVTKIEVNECNASAQLGENQLFSRVTVSLSSPPLIGQTPVETHGNPTLVFVVDQNDAQRLSAAISSRGLGGMFSTQSFAKHSVLRSPAALEIDLAGNLIGKQELEQRIENLSQIYETNELNDDSEGVHAIERDQVKCIDPSLLTLVPLGHVASSPATHSYLAGSGLEPSGTSCARPYCVSAAPSAGANNISSPPLSLPVTPARRTASQALRDRAFGTDDDALSEAERTPEPPRKPKKSTVDVVPGKAIKVSDVVLRKDGPVTPDFDDEMPVSTPSRPPPKKKVTVVSDDEIDEVVPFTKTMVSRRRSVLTMTAVTPSEPSSRSRRYSSRSKAALETPPTDIIILEASNDPPKSDTKPSPETRAPLCRGVGADGPLDSHRKNREDNEQVLSSPPILPVKKAVKSALRKKNQPLQSSPACIEVAKTSKRKKPGDGHDAETRSKRAKTDQVPGDSSDEKLESPLFDVALASAGRTERRYGGRKRRVNASPPAPGALLVDYDAIPGSTQDPPMPTDSKRARNKSKKATEKEVVEPKETSLPSAKKDKKVVKRLITAKATSRPAEPEAEQEERRKLKVRVDSSDDTLAEERPAVSTTAKRNVIDHAVPYVESQPTSGKDAQSKSLGNASPQEKSYKCPGNAVDNLETDQIGHNADAPAVDASSSTPGGAIDLPCSVEDTSSTPIDLDKFSARMTAVSTPAKVTSVGAKQARSRASDIKASPKVGSAENPTQNLMRVHQNEVSLDISPAVSSALVDKNQHDLPLESAQTAIFDPIAWRLNNRLGTKDPRPISYSKKLSPLPGNAQEDSSFTIPPKKARFDYIEKQELSLSASPGMEDLAKALQDIQQAVLHKITSRIEDARQEVYHGRELILEEAVADLATMRGESIDHYNNLIELEADYASFGRSLTVSLDGLTGTNRSLYRDIEKIIQTHDRGSIVKHAPTSLLSSKFPAALKRFHS